MLPRPVYQALPGLYVASGTASVFYLDIWTGKVSGLVLIAAGLIVLYWRMAPPAPAGRNRTSPEQRRTNRSGDLRRQVRR